MARPDKRTRARAKYEQCVKQAVAVRASRVQEPDRAALRVFSLGLPRLPDKPYSGSLKWEFNGRAHRVKRVSNA